jgi:hypothetical protein
MPQIAEFGSTLRLTGKALRAGRAHQDASALTEWMALEVLLTGAFSEKCDAWSFGVMMWECFTGGQLPYQTSKWYAIYRLAFIG